MIDSSNTLRTFWAVIFFSLVPIGASLAESRETESTYRYLDEVKAYAEAMIEYGRDTYGSEFSPLFAASLDRQTITLRKEFPPIEGIRGGDRAITGANPMHDQDLYQILYALSEITGDERYAEEADRAIEWFFTHCQSPTTGLMAWGEHSGWDFYKEDRIRDLHEFFGPWVLWDRSFDLAPAACRALAHGLWDHQIHKHSGDFSRHAGWDEHRTATGNGYPRHGGFYIRTWANAYERTKNEELLKAIDSVVDHYRRTSDERTEAIPCCTRGDRLDLVWPESNLSLAVDLWASAEKVPSDLAKKMRRRARKTDRNYLDLDHDFSPNGHGFVAGADADNLERLTEGPWTHTEVWSTGYGRATDAQIAMLCYLRYCQTKSPDYKRLILNAAKRYLIRDPNPDITLYPGSMADAISMMIAANELSGREEYLERAIVFADRAVDIFLDDSSPLPKASSKHHHYEAITGGDDLMLALLKVWTVTNDLAPGVCLTYNKR